MKKLLLGLTTFLALISTILYGACTGPVDMGNNQIINLGEPNASTDAATKAYVDNMGLGLPVASLTCDGAVHSFSNIGGNYYNEKILLVSGQSARTAAILNTHHITQIKQELSYNSSYEVLTAPNDSSLTDVNLTANQPLAITVGSVSDSGYKCLSGISFNVNVIGK